MNSAAKIVLGVLGVGVLVGGAIALSHAFPGGVTSHGDCGPLVMDAAPLQRYMTALGKVNMSPRSSALGMVRKLFRAAFPGCAFDNDTTATFVRPDGVKVEWQSIVALIGDKTLGEVAEDPELLNAVNALGSPGERVGSAGVVPDSSVGGGLKDILTTWFGGPLG
jgi:hypothetical protein